MASGYSDLSEIRKDRGPYGLHQKPAKINLLNEKPRRESLIEQQLTGTIVRPTLNQQANYQQPLEDQFNYGQPQLQPQTQQQQTSFGNVASGGSQQYFGGSSSQQVNYHNAGDPYNNLGPGTSKSTTSSTTTTKTYNQLMGDINPQQLPSSPSTSPFVGPDGSSTTSYSYSSGPGQTTTVTTKVVRKLISDHRTGSSSPLREPPPIPTVENTINTSRATTTTTTGTTTNTASTNYTELVNELAEKEAKLRREMAYLNQHLSPWARPPQVRDKRREPPARPARSESRWTKECPSGSSSRPNSRASSTRSTTEADLMEKADKLLQDVEEIERKPMKTQQILIEGGARPRSSASSSSVSPMPGVSSIHTAIIRVPNTEVDNKSPLPFAYDNFSTLGIRGNIASVGAAPPDTPYPPIFPTIKRGQSPYELNRR